jgi:hypothetical protein
MRRNGCGCANKMLLGNICGKQLKVSPRIRPILTSSNTTLLRSGEKARDQTITQKLALRLARYNPPDIEIYRKGDSIEYLGGVSRL